MSSLEFVISTSASQRIGSPFRQTIGHRPRFAYARTSANGITIGVSQNGEFIAEGGIYILKGSCEPIYVYFSYCSVPYSGDSPRDFCRVFAMEPKSGLPIFLV